MYYRAMMIVALLVMGVDQLVKYYLIGVMHAHHFAPLHVTSFFNLVMVWNKGVSFGILSSADARFGLMLLSGVVVSLLMWWYRKSKHYVASIAVGCIAGGALGNVIDRIYYKAVADFFDFHVMGHHWPAFNIADMSILTGVMLLIYYEWKMAPVLEEKKSFIEQ